LVEGGAEVDNTLLGAADAVWVAVTVVTAVAVTVDLASAAPDAPHPASPIAKSPTGMILQTARKPRRERTG